MFKKIKEFFLGKAPEAKVEQPAPYKVETPVLATPVAPAPVVEEVKIEAPAPATVSPVVESAPVVSAAATPKAPAKPKAVAKPKAPAKPKAAAIKAPAKKRQFTKKPKAPTQS
jgi:hypothetical protein